MINPKLITSRDDWAERGRAEKLIARKKYNRLQAILILKAILLSVMLVYIIVEGL